MAEDLFKHINSRKGSPEEDINNSADKDGGGNLKVRYSDESELVQRIKNGDERAFDTLFYNYRGKLFNFLKSGLPDDIEIEGMVHEAFLRVWLKRGELDARQGIQPFLFSIARNLLRDQLRKNLVRQKYLSGFLSNKEEAYSSPEKEMEYAELEKSIMDYIANMPERRRNIFELSRNEGKTYAQIARELGISENTVDTQIRKALNGLRRLLRQVAIYFF